MDHSTKQRIVGILVMVSAAVVLLPALFDGQGSYQMPLESRIPEPVPFPTLPTIVPERLVITADTDAIRVAESDPVEVPAPEVAAPTVETPVDPSTALQSVQQSAQQSAQPPDEPVPEPVTVAIADAPGLDNSGLPEGWSVRLASFSSYANALNLVDRLQSQGYRAYIREIPSGQGVLTAVFVGPGVDRAAVQQLQQQLQEEFQLSGIVVRYEIEEL